MDEIEKIHLGLKDFRVIEQKSIDSSKFMNLITGIHDPPSYIVRILLLGILDLRDYGRMDKVFWHTFFEFKDKPFMIRDCKFGSWTIEGLGDDEATLKLATEIQNKIRKASKKLNKVLSRELKSFIEKGDFYLNNVYLKLVDIYDFYEAKVSDEIKIYGELEKDGDRAKGPTDVIELFNAKLAQERVISNYSFAYVLIFFSFMEFLLDVIFAFEQPEKEFSEFRKDSWYDRFKLVFPINENGELKRLYDDLVRIKNTYRNPLAHGLTNELNLLVSLPHSGLVPLSYEYLSTELSYSLAGIGRDDASKITDTFSGFLRFIENKEPYKYYILYIKYGFPIPLDTKEIVKIKKKMTTCEDFENYLEKRIEYEDMIINRDLW
jgi:hypothetical protein